MDYPQSAMLRNPIMTPARAWVELGNIMLNKRHHSQKKAHHTLFCDI